jgi:hypothetical protein
MPNYIRIRLADGEVRHLNAGDTLKSGIVAETIHGQGGRGEWVRTVENTLVQRDQIVEAIFVQDEKEPKRLSDYV